VKRFLPDAAATEAFGAALAESLRDREGVVIHLRGDLGAGKTTLVRGLLRALGVGGRVRSPTYTLMEPYRAGDRSVIHLDLYRLVDPLELHNLGLTDFSPKTTWWLVEWPERGGSLLPAADVEIALRIEGAGRQVSWQGASMPQVT
jgi:tRNA threonylcarbamoyladenosine biosynthesis protein TsaE